MKLERYTFGGATIVMRMWAENPDEVKELVRLHADIHEFSNNISTLIEEPNGRHGLSIILKPKKLLP